MYTKYILVGLFIFLSGICVAQTSILWECNYCHQQYIGINPPRFTKCPARENKSTHWWIQKR